MSDFTEEEKRIVSYLRESVSAGERYFRAKNIADAIGLSAKQVGVRLPRLAETRISGPFLSLHPT